jgi:hypothetical protein
VPSPPFGMPNILFESRYNSSEARSGLRRFCLWENKQLTGILTGTRSLTTLAPHAFHLFPIPQSSIQATDHNLSYAGRDALHHLSSLCRCNCGRAIPRNLPSTRGFLRCDADCENGYRVNQPSSVTPSTDQRHLPMECGTSR